MIWVLSFQGGSLGKVLNAISVSMVVRGLRHTVPLT